MYRAAKFTRDQCYALLQLICMSLAQRSEAKSLQTPVRQTQVEAAALPWLAGDLGFAGVPPGYSTPAVPGTSRRLAG